MAFHLKLEIDDRKLRRLSADTRQALGKVVRNTAAKIELRAKLAIQTGPKTGRVYEKGETAVSFKTKAGKEVSFIARKGKKAKTHQASAPGEAPATDEGHLVNSIQTVSHGELSSEVRVGADYGATLELGSEDGKTAARPYLGPAVENVRPAFDRDVVKALGEAAQ